MNTEQWIPEGIDLTTGDYAYPAGTWRQFLDDPASQITDTILRENVLAVRDGYDETDWRECGWNLILPEAMPDATRLGICEALEPLVQHRRSQGRSREKPLLFRPLDTAASFLRRHRVGPGPVDPKQFPYYLMIVGNPLEIPFDFQACLGMEQPVGRLDFSTDGVHDLDAYASYARRVVEAEGAATRPPKPESPRMAIFAPRHPEDRATQSIGDFLLPGLLEHLRKRSPQWGIETHLAERARKTDLKSLLFHREPADLLLTAGHGLSAHGAPNQREVQGALICQDHGIGSGAAPEDIFLSAQDITDQEAPQPRLIFNYACHGGGTSTFDLARRQETPRQLASTPFVARLPQKILAHAGGNTLAIVGHVNRTWTASFAWQGGLVQRGAFEDTFQRLLRGYPVGAALEPFRQRFAAFSKEHIHHNVQDLKRMMLGVTLSKVGSRAHRRNSQEDHATRKQRYLGLWTAALDARSYTVLGDPAVRVDGSCVDRGSESALAQR